MDKSKFYIVNEDMEILNKQMEFVEWRISKVDWKNIICFDTKGDCETFIALSKLNFTTFEKAEIY